MRTLNTFVWCFLLNFNLIILRERVLRTTFQTKSQRLMPGSWQDFKSIGCETPHMVITTHSCDKFGHTVCAVLPHSKNNTPHMNRFHLHADVNQEIPRDLWKSNASSE